eukprot:3938910-Rhodomonas_salina.1
MRKEKRTWGWTETKQTMIVDVSSGSHDALLPRKLAGGSVVTSSGPGSDQQDTGRPASSRRDNDTCPSNPRKSSTSSAPRRHTWTDDLDAEACCGASASWLSAGGARRWLSSMACRRCSASRINRSAVPNAYCAWL